MNGVHDLGGMHGFGLVERDESTFHAEWERRINALLNVAVPLGLFNEDAFRYGIERMAPAVYLATPYYGRWLESILFNLVHHGWIDQQELDQLAEDLRERPDSLLSNPAAISRPPNHPPPAAVSTPRQRFSIGDHVVARNVHPAGHTRLPRYARGKRGVIHLVHAPEILPDINAHGPGAPLEFVYNVRFDAGELWGPSAEPRQTVSIDLWDSYLDPAGQ